MKHTPGPWIAVSNFEGGPFYIYSHMKSTNSDSVPIAVTKADSREHVDAHANARLIAAAPELLEACEIMMEALLKSQVPLNQISEIAHASQFLEMAIKKARGEY